MACIQEGMLTVSRLYDKMLVYAGMHAGFATFAGIYIYALAMHVQVCMLHARSNIFIPGWVSFIIDV